MYDPRRIHFVHHPLITQEKTEVFEKEATETLASFAVRFAVPIGVLVSFPFLLCRPAFEAVQRGAPALIMASIRYLIFSVPLALLGATLAERWGYEPFYGLAVGLLAGTAVVSVAFSAWLLNMLRGLGKDEAKAA